MATPPRPAMRPSSASSDRAVDGTLSGVDHDFLRSDGSDFADSASSGDEVDRAANNGFGGEGRERDTAIVAVGRNGHADRGRSDPPGADTEGNGTGSAGGGLDSSREHHDAGGSGGAAEIGGHAQAGLARAKSASRRSLLRGQGGGSLVNVLAGAPGTTGHRGDDVRLSIGRASSARGIAVPSGTPIDKPAPKRLLSSRSFKLTRPPRDGGERTDAEVGEGRSGSHLKSGLLRADTAARLDELMHSASPTSATAGAAAGPTWAAAPDRRRTGAGESTVSLDTEHHRGRVAMRLRGASSKNVLQAHESMRSVRTTGTVDSTRSRSGRSRGNVMSKRRIGLKTVVDLAKPRKKGGGTFGSAPRFNDRRAVDVTLAAMAAKKRMLGKRSRPKSGVQKKAEHVWHLLQCAVTEHGVLEDRPESAQQKDGSGKVQHLSDLITVSRAGAASGLSGILKTRAEALEHIEAGRVGTHKADIREQGKLSHYTFSEMTARLRIRTDPRLVAASLALWSLLTCNPDGSHVPHMDETLYRKWHRVMCGVLLPDVPEAEAASMAADDWAADSKGEPHISHKQFHDSIYELADQYCSSTSTPEYCRFVLKLTADSKKPWLEAGGTDPAQFENRHGASSSGTGRAHKSPGGFSTVSRNIASRIKGRGADWAHLRALATAARLRRLKRKEAPSPKRSAAAASERVVATSLSSGLEDTLRTDTPTQKSAFFSGRFNTLDEEPVCLGMAVSSLAAAKLRAVGKTGAASRSDGPATGSAMTSRSVGSLLDGSATYRSAVLRVSRTRLRSPDGRRSVERVHIKQPTVYIPPGTRTSVDRRQSAASIHVARALSSTGQMSGLGSPPRSSGLAVPASPLTRPSSAPAVPARVVEIRPDGTIVSHDGQRGAAPSVSKHRRHPSDQSGRKRRSSTRGRRKHSRSEGERSNRPKSAHRKLSKKRKRRSSRRPRSASARLHGRRGSHSDKTEERSALATPRRRSRRRARSASPPSRNRRHSTDGIVLPFDPRNAREPDPAVPVTIVRPESAYVPGVTREPDRPWHLAQAVTSEATLGAAPARDQLEVGDGLWPTGNGPGLNYVPPEQLGKHYSPGLPANGSPFAQEQLAAAQRESLQRQAFLTAHLPKVELGMCNEDRAVVLETSGHAVTVRPLSAAISTIGNL